MAKWYYRIEGREVGPVSESELKKAAESNVIVRDTPVKREGMDGWVEAKKVKGLIGPKPAISDDATETPDPLMDVLLDSLENTPPPIRETRSPDDFFSDVKHPVRKQRPTDNRKAKESAQQALGFIGAIVGVAIIAIVSLYYFGGGLEREAARELDRIEQQVAADAVKQYEIAKRNGSAMDAYVQAGFVAAAYLQANDEANYRKWKNIERSEGKRAGMPEELLD